MKRLWPKSMAGQAVIVLLIGLTLSHIISMVIYSADRAEILTLVGERHIAHRVAVITRLLDETPEAWRAQIVDATNSPSLGVTVTPISQLIEGQDKGIAAALIGKFLARLVGGGDRKVFVQLLDLSEVQDEFTTIGGMHWRHLMTRNLFLGNGPGPLMRASVQLDDGQWVNFATAVSDANPLWSSQAFYSMLLMSVGVVLLSLWVIRRVTKPLRLFAAAADRLGKDVHTSPMDETGPQEILYATRAFNRMQARLQRLIENRTRMLAAISHDLRTPVTLLRLRAEYVENAEEREKMLATLSEMEQMVSSTLTFAGEDTEKEPPETVDIGALITSITNDLIDMGKAVECDIEENVELTCRPAALRRALSNVIENAIGYAGSAEVTMKSAVDSVRIAVVDDGPGIPEDEMEMVFSPFHRVERSRNRETGGVGLGLSIAQTIINGHGGDISLANRAEGGLKVDILLPR